MADSPYNESKRTRYERMRSRLYSERSTFYPSWKDCNDFISPRRARFFVSDSNRGDRRNQKIIDNTATVSADRLSAGMMSGLTSPARKWFSLETPDPDLNEFGHVKEWLYMVGLRMSSVFNKSNFYNSLKVVYKDLGIIGTSPLILEPDIKDTIRTYCFPVGSYYLANDERMQVGVFARDFQLTVRQLVKMFGVKDEKTGQYNWDNFSTTVRQAYERGDYEMWIEVRHFITPNEEYDPTKLHSKYKKFSSCYYEAGNSGSGAANYLTSSDDERYLRESGYDYFPVMAARWGVTGEDAYATEWPALNALGDIKSLQLMHKRKAEAIEKLVRPPLTGPSSLRTQKVSILPADVTYHDVRDGQQGLRPIFEVDPRIQELVADIQDHRGRIKSAFYEDILLLISNDERAQPATAEEIIAKKEERLMAMGPVLEQLDQDLLDPAIANTFQIMLERGEIPPPPEELHGMVLSVKYESVMAQAQKLIGISSVERFAGFTQNIVAAHPESGDKINTDQMIEVYGEMTSIPPGIMRSDDEVAQIRQQRAKSQQQQQQMEMINQAAGAAKNMSQADMGGDNALTRLMDQAKAGSILPEQ